MTEQTHLIIIVKRAVGRWPSPIMLAQQLRNTTFGARLSYNLYTHNLTTVIVTDTNDRERVISHLESQGWEIVETSEQTAGAIAQAEAANSYETGRIKTRSYITVTADGLL